MKLQKPEFVYMGGALRPWAEATLHVGCEAVTRGLSVFEGLKGYRQPDGSMSILMLQAHYQRLQRSARLLHIPFEMPFEGYKDALIQVARVLVQPDTEMWFRTTLFVVEGHWGENTVADLVVTGYQCETELPPPINLGVSSWRRSPDVSLPARIKAASNYQVSRMARIEGRRSDCEDMILLNDSGRVAEATGACILMVRNGRVITTPASEGALESITADVIEILAESMHIPFVRRPIDRTELIVADGLAICGTLAEIVPVKMIEGVSLKPSPLLQSIQDRYMAAVRGVKPHPAVELTPIGQPNLAVRGTSARKGA